MVRISSNGRYIAAPTYQGGVFFFDIKSGNVTGILNDHSELEVRDVIFHPTKKMLFTCADGKISSIFLTSLNIYFQIDGSVNVYRQN